MRERKQLEEQNTELRRQRKTTIFLSKEAHEHTAVLTCRSHDTEQNVYNYLKNGKVALLEEG